MSPELFLDTPCAVEAELQFVIRDLNREKRYSFIQWLPGAHECMYAQHTCMHQGQSPWSIVCVPSMFSNSTKFDLISMSTSARSKLKSGTLCWKKKKFSSGDKIAIQVWESCNTLSHLPNNPPLLCYNDNYAPITCGLGLQWLVWTLADLESEHLSHLVLKMGCQLEGCCTDQLFWKGYASFSTLYCSMALGIYR